MPQFYFFGFVCVCCILLSSSAYCFCCCMSTLAHCIPSLVFLCSIVVVVFVCVSIMITSLKAFSMRRWFVRYHVCLLLYSFCFIMASPFLFVSVFHPVPFRSMVYWLALDLSLPTRTHMYRCVLDACGIS